MIWSPSETWAPTKPDPSSPERKKSADDAMTGPHAWRSKRSKRNADMSLPVKILRLFLANLKY